MGSSTTNRFFRTISFWGLSVMAWGCSLQGGVDITGNPPPPTNPTGTLTQRWSIGGRFNAQSCAAYGADRMQLVVRDMAGNTVARAFQNCEDMRMTITLGVGSYSAEAFLVSTTGTPVSTTLQLRPFQIARGTDTYIDTDFPISSILNAYG